VHNVHIDLPSRCAYSDIDNARRLICRQENFQDDSGRHRQRTLSRMRWEETIHVATMTPAKRVAAKVCERGHCCIRYHTRV